MKQRYWLAAAFAIALGGIASAQAPGLINAYNALCSASFPTRCVTVTAAGEVPVTGTISATSAATATAADPSYVEGTANPLSQDLSGHIRIAGSISATSSATATAAAPAYVEGTSNAISQNLTGDQRVIAKQSGTWILGANSGVDIGDVTINNANGAAAVNIQDGGNSITVDGTVTVTDGAGALNVIVDSGTLTAVTTITNPVTVTDGAGALNVIVDSGVITTITNPVTVTDGAGALNVIIDSGTTAVTNAGTFAVQPAGSIAFDGGAAAVNPVLNGCYASAAAPTDVSADNDATRDWCLRNGARATVLTAAGALIGGDAANGIDVDVTRLPALVAGSAIIGKVGIDQTTPGTTNLVQVTDGAGALNVIVDSGTTAVTQATAANLNATVIGAGTAGTANAGVVTVQGIASMTKLLVTPDSVALPANQSVNLAQVGGTNTVSGGVAGSQSIGGTVATNVAITANPVNLGAQAVSSENAAVTTARQVQLVADLVGKLIVLPYANPENFVSGVTAAMTGTTTTSLVAAPASGLRNYITHLICTNSHATVGTFVLIQDGSGGTTIYEGYAAAVGGGFSISFPTPLRQPTTATALFVADVTTGANVICAGSGYKGA